MLVIVKGADGKQYIKYEPKKENDRYPTVREIKEFVKNREKGDASKMNTKNIELWLGNEPIVKIYDDNYYNYSYEPNISSSLKNAIGDPMEFLKFGFEHEPESFEEMFSLVRQGKFLNFRHPNIYAKANIK